tara:strand:- start:47 stop:406 length:360 start_codon:yes stop_codon:yes gene_type:complete
MKYLIGLIVVFVFSACSSKQSAVNHVVFVELDDPSQVQEFIKDSNTRLATIAVVEDYFCGTHVPSNRDSVLKDYDVGIYFGFDSLESYKEYVEHQNHIDFIEDWRPGIKDLRVYDISGY